MPETLISLIVQMVAGAFAGNATRAAPKNLDLGRLGNTLAGAIGGAAGAILTAIVTQ